MKKRGIAFLSLFLVALFVWGCKGKEKTTGEKGGGVVGVVGNEKVTWAEFKKELDNLPPYYRRFLRNANALSTYLKKYLIRKAMVLEAEKRGYENDPKIKRQIERYKEQLLIRKLREEMRKKQMSVTDDEIKEYYEKHKDRFKVGEQRKIREIMVKVSPNAPEKEWLKAKRKIEKALRELKRGIPWEKVFKKYNEDETIRVLNGELPYFSRNRRIRYYMDDNFINAVFNLKKPGDMTIVKTRYGYVLVQLRDVKPPHTREFIEVAPEIKRELEQKKRILQEKKLEDMLVKKYGIKVYTDVLAEFSGGGRMNKKATKPAPVKPAPVRVKPASQGKAQQQTNMPGKMQKMSPQQKTPSGKK